ncbi:MAG: ATP-binding protein [Candidatus Hydrogenedentes bacterium]|nr:ATP-binding protein [Candidatus Hydrogenedentota bacterium]
MNYDRERRLAEQKAKGALEDKDLRMAAYYLFKAARLTLQLAGRTEGRIRDSLKRLAKKYEERGDRLLLKVKQDESRPKRRVPGGEDEEEKRWAIEQRPTTRLDDVAGMDDVKQLLRTKVIEAQQYSGLYEQYRLEHGGGVLLYGPPGTGKTYFAEAVAGELEVPFFPVKLEKVLSKWFGETEQLLAQLFEAARQHPMSVIFFDELEAIMPRRGSTHSSVMDRVVPQLLQLTNGLEPSKHAVILLAATNKPWLLDSAATRTGRFGTMIYVGPPDAEARRFLFNRQTRGVPTDGVDVELLVQRTDGYSGADIAHPREGLCAEARLHAFMRTVQKIRDSGQDDLPPEPVMMEDFEVAFGKVRPSIDPAELKRFEEFRAAAGRR